MKLVADDVQSRGHARHRPLGRRAGSRGDARGADRVPGPVPGREAAGAAQGRVPPSAQARSMTAFEPAAHAARSTGRPGGSIPSRSVRAELRGPRRPRRLLDADVHQLAAHASRTSARGRETYRDDGLVVDRRPHARVPVRARRRQRARAREGAGRSSIRSRSTTTTRSGAPSTTSYWPAALLRRRGGTHPRPPLRRGRLRGVGARSSSGCSASSASSSRSRRTASRRRPTGTNLRSPETYLGYEQSAELRLSGRRRARRAPSLRRCPSG